MNADRRKALNLLVSQVEEIKGQLENLQQEEQDYYDAMHENLQGGDKGSRAQEAADQLQEAVDSLETAIESINSATE